MTNNFKCRIFALVATLFLATMGCKTGVDSAVSTATDGGRAGSTVTLSFGSVSNPTTVAPGADAFTFSVYYNDSELELTGCHVENGSGVTISDAGTTSSTSTSCTYTPPSAMPAGAVSDGENNTFSANVVVDIANTSLATTATLEVIISEAAVGSCTTYLQCETTELCYYGTCMEWALAGVDVVSPECDSNSDCSGGKMCVRFNTASDCKGYCTDLTVFGDVDLGYPSTEALCDAVTGAVWYSEIVACSPADVEACIADTDETVCNDNLVADCHDILDSATCENSYAVWTGSLALHNCGWRDDYGCYIWGFAADDHACVIPSCDTYEDCAAGETCHFNTCRTYAEAGLTNMGCTEDVDCVDYCGTFMTTEGCQNFCVNESIFLSADLDAPASSDACVATGGEWNSGDAKCDPADLIACNEPAGACNASFVASGCMGIEEQAECEVSYSTMEQDGVTEYHNCMWDGDEGSCYAYGFFGSDACELP